MSSKSLATRARRPNWRLQNRVVRDAHSRLAPAYAALWEDPVPLGATINTAGFEDSPFVTPDGETLYFWFTPDASAWYDEEIRDRVTGIWRSQREEYGWGRAERVFLSDYDEAVLDGAPTVRGATLWFASARAGGFRNIDIYQAQLVDGRWVNWTNAGERLNREFEVGELHVTAGGDEIYFDSRRAGGRGGKDIWRTRSIGGEWQPPSGVDAVNGPYDDGWPAVTEDGQELWFTRAQAAPEVMVSRRAGGDWQPPEVVVSSLAGEPTLDRRGNLYFVHHYWDDRTQRLVESDLYLCRRR